MKKITSLFTLFLGWLGITASLAQSNIAGTYQGELTLSHLTGTTSSESDQTLTITETSEGTVNVVFPSFAILGQFATGEITIEGVTATPSDDGSFALAKEQFTASAVLPSGMTTAYAYSSLSGTVYANGDVELTVQVVQNPNVGAVTTALFLGYIPDVVSPIANAYNGSLKQQQLTGAESTDDDKSIVITKASPSTANVTFPSLSVLGQFATGEFTVEGVDVTAQADGSYLLTKEPFTISITLPNGMSTAYGYSALSGTIAADGTAQLTVKVIQNPNVGALTTATFTGQALDASTFVWGKASWNLDNNAVYSSVEDFQNAGLALTYPNPTGYSLTFLHVIAVSTEIYMDDNKEPVNYTISAQGTATAAVKYDFAEGHDYRIVVTGATLVKANLATFVTDTLSTNSSSYTFSFRINGPELQRTIDVDAYMSLSIVDQNATPTISEVNVEEITAALGIGDISEATVHPLNGNGSYNDHMDVFDWWRDADGEFTMYYSGWNSILGHNAYPAVYCIKLNATADTVSYYFYDYWTEYDPNDPGSVPGTGTGAQAIKQAAPQTSYNSVIWDWTNEDGTTTQYKRNYRVDEGADYEAKTLFVANGKSVLLHATLHFVSQEEYENVTGIAETDITARTPQAGTGEVAYYSLGGTRLPAPQRGINIVRKADGSVQKILVK